jgi:hypothetical protein
VSRWISSASAVMDLDAYEEPGDPTLAEVLARPRLNYCCIPSVHDAIKADPARWASLPLVGTQECVGVKLELRNCDVRGCQSTLAIEVRP